VEDAWTGGWSGSSTPPPGARRRLTAAQLARLPVLLRHGPEAYGFQGQLWTCGRMAAVIRVACGVSCHPRHVGRLCQAMRQKPEGKPSLLDR
jgi:transposase